MVYRATKRRKTLRKRKGRRSFKRYRGGVKPPLAPAPRSVRSVGSAGSAGSAGSVGSAGSSGSVGRVLYRAPSQTANNIARRKAFKEPFDGLNFNAIDEEYTQSLCGEPTGKGPGCPCTKGSSNGALKKLFGRTECGSGTTCTYDESNTIKHGAERHTCQPPPPR
jgi:hypothetical protein